MVKDIIQFIILAAFGIAVYIDLVPKFREGDKKKIVLSTAFLSVSLVLMLIYSANSTFFHPITALYDGMKAWLG